MVIDMNESRLRTIEQREDFLSACGPVAFTAAGEDGERGVVLRYLQHTCGYSRAQVTRLVTAGSV